MDNFDIEMRFIDFMLKLITYVARASFPHPYVILVKRTCECECSWAAIVSYVNFLILKVALRIEVLDAKKRFLGKLVYHRHNRALFINHTVLLNRMGKAFAFSMFL